MTHAELWEAVQLGGGRPGASKLAESRWRDLVSVITEAEIRMHAAVARTAGDWTGPGGDAARTGLHSLNSWVLGAAADAQTTLAAMMDQDVASGRLVWLMPNPNTERLLAAREAADVELFDEGIQRGLLDAEDEARARDEDAREAMQTYHFQSVANRQKIDFWTTPPTVVVEAVPPGAGPGTAGRGGGLPEFAGASGSPVPAASTPFGGVPSGADGALPGTGGPVVASLPLPGGGPDGGGNPSGVGVNGLGSNGSGGAAGGGAATSGSGVATGAGGGIVGGGGPAVAGAPGPSAANPSRGDAAGATPAARTGGATPALSRDALPPGAGGRGPRGAPSGGLSSGATGMRGTFPGGPAGGGASPSWRDVVAGLRGGTPGGTSDPLVGRGGGADPPAGPRGGVGPRPEVVRAVASPPVAEAGRGATGHGIYPPMGGGTAGGQGESRRRAPFLVDDSGVFDVDVPYTDPVIGGVALTSDEAR